MKMVKLILVLLLLISNVNAMDMAGTGFIDLVRFISNTSKINIVVDEEINTKFNVIFPNDYDPINALSILKTILYKNKMVMVKRGNIYYIKKIDSEEQYYSIKLRYLLPDKVIDTIRLYHPTIVVSKSKKTIIYKSNTKVSKEIAKLVSLLDKPTKSKKIKISLISFKNNDIDEFGVQMSLGVKSNQGDISYKSFLSNIVSSQSLLINLTNAQLNFFIQDLRTKEIIDLKYSPTLTLYDNEITKFNITQNIPYMSENRSVNGSNDVQSNSYQYKDVGSKIIIDKVSIIDGAVYFHIKMQYEIIVDRSLTPVTAKRSIDNYIKLEDGKSLVISGIKSNELRDLKIKIPFLSGIPYLGKMFEYDSTVKNDETFTIIVSNIYDKASLF